MSRKAAVPAGYQTIALSLLDESTTNPRRTFEPVKLQELADSIRTHGLIQPITVRPLGERYEIVAGARRYRAAQIAELTELPVRVLDLTDAQTLEVQIIENSQRQDVHPYEEASGYQRLLDLPGYDVAALAQKCGKSQSHIYARLTLLALIPDVAEAFQQERITASHANLIARLTPEQQAEAFQQCWRKDWQDKDAHLLPAKYLAAWIQKNLYLPLDQAPFSTEDQELVPEAGACVTCPKRSGFNTQLFADVHGDQCFDSTCYQAKVAASLEQTLAQEPELVQISSEYRPSNERRYGELAPSEYTVVTAESEDDELDAQESGHEEDSDEESEAVNDQEDGEAPARPPVAVCSATKTALVVNGSGTGKKLTICTDQDCPVHHPPNTNRSHREAQRQEQARRDKEREKAKAAREKLFSAILSRVPESLTTTQLRFLLRSLILGDDLDFGMEHMAMRVLGNDETNETSDDVCLRVLEQTPPLQFLAELALGSHVFLPDPERRDLLKEAAAVFPDDKQKPHRKAAKASQKPTKAGEGQKAPPTKANPRKGSQKRGKR